jgi:1-acyl-sn-glycerol-3-phosphate acyltransferase
VNHVTLSVDAPVLFSAIYHSTGQYPRALGDRMHFHFPVISQTLRLLGCFEGNVENTSKLMSTGQPILVFPGGGREVCRRTTDPKYSLFWGQRTGFARLAIQHGYSIVCIGSVGVEEQLGILYDIPVWPVLYFAGDKRANEGFTFPLVFLRSLLPQKIFLYSGSEIIDTSQYEGDSCEKNQVIVRDKARSLLLEAIDEGRRQQQRERGGQRN